LQSYLAAGIPLLSMLNGEGSQVVEAAGAGMTCKAGDSHGLAQAVLKLVSMTPDERQAMGNNGAAASAAQFDRDRLISQLESMYRGLIGARDNKDRVEIVQ
jgi:glycosyltransferase involved in cell wall biosynthesis